MGKWSATALSALKTVGVIGLGLLAIVLAKGVGALIGSASVDQFSEGYREGASSRALAVGLDKAVRQLKSQVPVQVDEITTLRDAMATSNEIIYLMEVSQDFSTTDLVVVKAQLQTQNQKNVCDNAGTRQLVAAGGKMTWRYLDAGGDTFSVTVDTCPSSTG